MQGWDLKGPLENIVAGSSFAVARAVCSLFSPLSPSFHLAPRALGLQAHDLLRRSWKSKAHRSKRKSRCDASASSFVLYRLNRCHPQKVNKIKGFRVFETGLSASLIDATLHARRVFLFFYRIVSPKDISSGLSSASA